MLTSILSRTDASQAAPSRAWIALSGQRRAGFTWEWQPHFDVRVEKRRDAGIAGLEDNGRYSQFTSPTSGSLNLNPDGSFTYTPNADFAGSDSFSYKTSDGALESNSATIIITTTLIDDPPVIALPGPALTYTEDDPEVVIDPSAWVW